MKEFAANYTIYNFKLRGGLYKVWETGKKEKEEKKFTAPPANFI
jgi:L-rhamnose mutarotase